MGQTFVVESSQFLHSGCRWIMNKGWDDSVVRKGSGKGDTAVCIAGPQPEGVGVERQPPWAKNKLKKVCLKRAGK